MEHKTTCTTGQAPLIVINYIAQVLILQTLLLRTYSLAVALLCMVQLEGNLKPVCNAPAQF